jgi:hypothetical protein
MRPFLFLIGYGRLSTISSCCPNETIKHKTLVINVTDLEFNRDRVSAYISCRRIYKNCWQCSSESFSSSSTSHDVPLRLAFGDGFLIGLVAGRRGTAHAARCAALPACQPFSSPLSRIPTRLSINI